MKMSIVSKFFPALFLAFFSVAALNAQTENAPAGKPQLQKAERQRKHDDRTIFADSVARCRNLPDRSFSL